MPNRITVTVVGGGIIGCAVAYELGRRGADVCVLERRDVGQGATQASAGILAPFIEADHAGPLRQLCSRSLELYSRFVSDVVADSGVVVPYERCGTLEAAMDASSLARLERAARALSETGLECRLLSAAEALIQEPHLGPSVIGALHVPSHGFVAASALTTALRGAAMRHGVSFLAPCAVTRLTSTGSGMSAETNQGPRHSDVVVLAAGSWTEGLEFGQTPSLPVRPVRGQLLQLRWPTGPRLKQVVWSTGCYVVPWPDGTTLVGATVEDVGFDEGATVTGVMSLLDAAREVLPATEHAGFEAVRVGLRPGTADDLPVIGTRRSAPRLVYATGHYRNGVLLAPVTAQLVGDLVLEVAPGPLLEGVSPDRFASAPDARAGETAAAGWAGSDPARIRVARQEKTR
ncbi:MAG: glycine oxidase ThiO [Acidobacteria bacterium]|nr:glycine oxidase ThiO [Acidobacteriota bacterium]